MNKLLELSFITIGSRFRQDYGDMASLCRLIRSTRGLQFHKIVVEQIDQDYFLRAGGRRFKAYEMLSSGDPTAWPEDYTPTDKEKEFFSAIPCTILKDLTLADRLRIEYIENKGRKDTTWQEDAPLAEEFHAEMQRLYGAANPGRGKDGWSLRDTAKELGVNPAELVHLLSLAKQLKIDPKLQNIQRKSKALTHIKRSKNIAIADLLDLKDFRERGVEIRCGDSKQELLSLENDSVDLILTDPPWDIGFEDRISQDRNDSYETKYDSGYDIMDTLTILTICYQKLKPNSGIYMFYSVVPEKVLEAQKLLITAGFITEPIPLIWYKGHVLSHNSGETRHYLNYESFLYAWKGERPLLNHPSKNVFEHQVSNTGRIHASEKPEALLAELILLNTKENTFVLDPWGGSCKVADACLSHKRRCLVVELEESLVKLANMRLRGL